MEVRVLVSNVIPSAECLAAPLSHIVRRGRPEKHSELWTIPRSSSFSASDDDDGSQCVWNNAGGCSPEQGVEACVSRGVAQRLHRRLGRLLRL